MDKQRVSVVLVREAEDMWSVSLTLREPDLIQTVKRRVTDAELRQADFWAMHVVFPLSEEDDE